MLILSALITGIATGSMYGLLALGFHVTWAVSRTVNFAQGSSMMLGAVLLYGLAVSHSVPGPVAVLVALALCGMYGARRPRPRARGPRAGAGGRLVFPDLSVRDNLRLGALLRRDGDIAADIEAMLARFPRFRARAEGRAGLLSGGEQQMLALARGLMARPRLLLLDEPSLGLAPQLVEQVFEELAALRDADARSCSSTRTRS